MISNETAFWDWFKKTKDSNFRLIQEEEGYYWKSKTCTGHWEESDMWFDTPYDALVDFFSNLICCKVVEE